MKAGKLGFGVALLAGGVVLILSYLALAGGVGVSVLSEAKEVGPGEFITHVFSVTNEEDTPDTFSLTYTAPKGWGLLGAPTNLTLNPGEEGTLFLTVTVPPGAAAGEYEIELSAVSQSDPTIKASASAKVTVKPVNEVEIIPPEGGSVPPGGKLSYTFTVVNRGNAQDMFKIEASSAQGFPVSLSQQEVSLSPQEKREITVELNVPMDVSPGRDPLTVSVTSALYPGVQDQVIVFTTILPPPPQAVGGTLLDVLSARLRFSIDHNVFTNDLDSDLYFSLAGGVYDGYFSSTLHLSPIFGPGPTKVTSFTLQYRKTPATCTIGDTSQRLTDLLSVYCRGGKIEIEADNYTLYLIGGGAGDETRFGGRISLGPQEANLGISYIDLRNATRRAAVWSLSASAEPLEDWSIRLEGALGIDGSLTSRAFYFNTKLDTTPYFLSGEAFSIGTYFPGSRPDQVGISISQRLRMDNFSLGASFTHEWDNVIGDPLIETTITDQLGLSIQATPLDDGPTVTSTCKFTWERNPDLTKKDEIYRLLSIGLSDRYGVFPYSFFAKLRDQLDSVTGTSYRTLTFKEGVGLSTDAFGIYLDLTQERSIDLVTAATVSTSNDVSLRFSVENSPHSAQLSLSNTGDNFDLSLSGEAQLLDNLQLELRGTVGWDRGDAAPPTFGWKATFNWKFDFPAPFLVTKGRIEGRVFIDSDENGRYNEGDRPVDGAIISTQSTQVSTDASGHFRLPPAAPGRYALKLSHLPPDAALGPLVPQVDLEAGSTVWLDIPLTPVAHLKGVLFNDANKNGTFDPGEGGFAQVRVVLSGPGGTTDTYTDLAGRFEFTGLVPGNYTLSVDEATLPERFSFTTNKEITLKLSATSAPQVTIGGYIKPKQVVITFQPPTADFTYSPENPKAGQQVTFDASDSFDFDGEVVSYVWDFTGDGKPDASGETVTYTFPAPGAYDVTLTVTDNDGNTDSLTATIVVK